MPDATPCLAMWDGCPSTADEGHVCERQTDHDGRCRCGACGATTTRIDPIFYDDEELERALDVLD